MTVLRRYLFLFLAVCTALAVGIAVGGGPLQGRLTADDHTTGWTTELGQTVSSLQRAQLFDDAVSQATAPQVVRNRLVNRGVAVLVLPGVPDATVLALVDAIEQAGGTVPVTARLSSDLVNPAKKTYVDSVAESSLRGLDDVAKAAGAETYERIGTLVARAYVGHGDVTDFDEEAADIDAELQGARLVSTQVQPTARGALVVLLAPRASPPNPLTTAANVIVGQLVTAVAAGSDGVLVAGPPSSSSSGGLLKALGHVSSPPDASVSTLNVIGSAAGQIAAVYALESTAQRRPGDYGVVAGDVRLPPGLASVVD